MSGWPGDEDGGDHDDLSVRRASGSEKAAAHRLGLSHSTVKHHLVNAQLVWILAPRLSRPWAKAVGGLAVVHVARRPHHGQMPLETSGRPSLNAAALKSPSAWLPLAMSLGALALVIGHVATVGVARQADEGTAAHLWQLLMAGQIPVIALFAIQWLPRRPRQAVAILAVQAAAAVAAAAPVFLLDF